MTFTDPAGDANGLDGANGTGSQASFDIVKVWLGPHLPTKSDSGITVRLTLSAAPNTTPGSSIVFAAKQIGCDITVTKTFGVDGATPSSIRTTCGDVSAHGSTTNDGGAIIVSGTSLIVSIPAGWLLESRRGAGVSNIAVSTAVGDPATGAAAPAAVDTARYAKVYRVGS